MDRSQWLVVALLVLALGLALNSLLGPLVTEAIRYRFSETLINQGIGLDALSLLVVAPLALAAAILKLQRHPAGAVLALPPAMFSAYMMPQYVVGPDYLGIAGNNEQFFPLHFGLFTLSAAIILLAWTTIDARALPPLSPGIRRLAVGLLVALPLFMLLGLYLPGFADALSDQPSRSEYLDNPTSFWLISFLDLAIVAPASLATALALLRGAAWSQKAMYALVGWFALVPPSVASMAIVMLINDDHNASWGSAIMFSIAAVIFVCVALLIFRPLLLHGAPAAGSPAQERQTAG